MRRALWVSLLLAACNAQADPERQFDIAMNTGTYADVCAAARKTADDYLARGDQAKFERWRLTRDIYCATAARDPGGMPSTQAAVDAAAAAENNRAIAAMLNSADPEERRMGRIISGLPPEEGAPRGRAPSSNAGRDPPLQPGDLGEDEYGPEYGNSLAAEAANRAGDRAP